MDTLITTLISLFSAAASFIPATATSRKTLFDYRSNLFNAIKFRGWLTILCLTLSIGLTIYQAIRNKEQSDKKDNEVIKRENKLRLQYDSSLTEMKRKFDTSNIKTIGTISNTLGIYGYKLDSANFRLVKVIKDSSKTKIISGNDPVLSVCYDDGLNLASKRDSLYKFNLSFCSYDAGCANININCITVSEDSDKDLISVDSHKTFNIIPVNHKLPKDGATKSDFTFIKPSNDDPKLIRQFIYVKGTYTNLDGTKKYSIDELYAYDFESKKTHVVAGESRDRVIKFISNK